MIRHEEVIQIGIIGRPHGKSGEISCHVTNEYWEESNAQFLILEINALLVPFYVESWRAKGIDTLLFRLEDIVTEEQAITLTHCKAYMLKNDITTIDEENDLTWQDLIGYHVYSHNQTLLGIITLVDESTANTLASTNTGKLLPLHEDLILHLDVDTQTIVLNVPDTI
ncbi:MAG: hypothetical protein J6J29_04090 [Paludibacteraceae bacterium]|nr:hypothetical protein [Paludibacteraceae bacterium]